MKYIKYIIFAVVSLIIAKWIIMFLPTNEVKNNTVREQKIQIKKAPEVKEVELSIDLKELEPKVEKEYENAKEDINRFIEEQINTQKEEAKYRLIKEDGFLDWLFGYFTGWKIMYKKVKGFFGSDDNEVKFVSDKFEKEVINPGLNDMFERINEYSKNRMEDYYKQVILITTDYINQHIKELKEQGYTDIKIDTSTIPWSQYIVARGGDLFTVSESVGFTGVGLVVSKYVSSKIAAIIGPKVLGLVEVKTASIIAGKIASMFEFLLAPIIDYAANEAVKAVKYDETKENFEKVIDEIFDEVEENLGNNANNNLLEVKNEIYEELNKKVKIKAKEIK